MPDFYAPHLLLTPGAVIPHPIKIPGFDCDFYETLEVLDEHSQHWLVVARAGQLRHVYRLRLVDGEGLVAQRVKP